MPIDPVIRDHQAWLGYLQPDGLVVSPAALADAQVALDRNAAPLQQRFLELVLEWVDDDKPAPVISSLRHLLSEFLEWPNDCVCGLAEGRPIPESLKIPLKEFGETLEPTFAFEKPNASDADDCWLLLVQELPPGTDLDAARESTLSGWAASPSRRFERLLREAGVPIGLISNATHLRLIYAPRGENTGTITFPIAAMTEVAGRPILAAFEMLLSKYRLLAAPKEARLPSLLKRSRDYQARVSTTLAKQVLDALYELLHGFQAADDRAHGDLLRDTLEEDPDSIYAGLLTVLMRLVFLLYAEDRGLMPGSDLYVRNYAIHGLFEKLRTDAEQNPDTMDHRYGAWAQIIALCRAVYNGCEHSLLKMPAREGHLFDPARYPFLEGQTLPDQRLPLVPDGTIERVLRKLLVLDGQRLSYRTLDVEQIGSVYETMMGFRLERASGLTIALKPAKAHGAPVPVNLDDLVATSSADRKKAVQDQTDYKLTTTMNNAVKAAESTDDLLAALERRIARNATPQPVANDTMVLVPTDERRKTGSHYTPRSLTEPIVRTTLEPILKQLGEKPTPDQILELKICDPAMGSGAFLVEACRQLADELVNAWVAHGWKPQIPPDEDEVLYARRLIAPRCLYGVDRNPMAVDLAKLSLWLATLARDHPFTFLDHSLRCGDSLVGLTRKQIVGFDLEPKSEPTFVQEKVNARMKRVSLERRQILEAGDNMPPANKQQKLAKAEEDLSLVRLAGDAVVAAYFSGTRARDRAENRDALFNHLAAWLQQADADARQKLGRAVDDLRTGVKAVTPFHWEIEFPEVFDRDAAGFDAFIGNPPFAGKNTLLSSNRDHYLDWLKAVHEGAHGNADLVAHFFRRTFDLLRNDGVLGLIATNTIGQGDTRATGLTWICTHGGTIFHASRRFKWPGLAAVVVSTVHVTKGGYEGKCRLDGRKRDRITAYLFHDGGHESPATLAANSEKSFIGNFLLGMGFTFDDTGANDTASPLSLMHQLTADDPGNTDVIFPFIGGEEVNNNPALAHHRYCIEFFDRSLEESARWPDLLEIVRSRVKPERDKQKRKAVRERWWHHAEKRPGLHRAKTTLDHVFVTNCGASPHLSFGRLPADMVFSHTLTVITIDDWSAFAILQGRVHELWARFFSSSMKDDLRYTPSDCFETCPFPPNFGTDSTLAALGNAYYDFRAETMVRKNEGFTTIYNSFHDPGEGSEDFVRLHELHDAIDQAVLDAYGWGDLVNSGATTCGFALDYLDVDDEDLPDDMPETLWFPTADEALTFAGRLPSSRRRLPWRYRWPEETRNEVLARLLKLNAERAEEERRLGLGAEASAKKKSKSAKRGRKKVAAPISELFAEQSGESALPPDLLEPVPMLEAVELMVAILDELHPARVQQVVAERMFVLAVNNRARYLYEQGGTAPTTVVSQPGAPFRALWQSVVAMKYATLSDGGMVARTDQSVTLTKPEHSRVAKEAVSLFKKGEAIKLAWPVEVDNVQHVVS